MESPIWAVTEESTSNSVLLVTHPDSDSSVRDTVLAPQPPDVVPPGPLKLIYPQKAIEPLAPKYTFRENPLSSTLPLVYTAYLLGAAIQSGPGWSGEVSWSLGGILLGLPGAFVGAMLAMAPGFDNAPDPKLTAISFLALPLITLPFVLPIWMEESHQQESRENRKWERRGSSAFGLISGAAIYIVFPIKYESMAFQLAFLNAALGTVVGYRLGWDLSGHH